MDRKARTFRHLSPLTQKVICLRVALAAAVRRIVITRNLDRQPRYPAFRKQDDQCILCFEADLEVHAFVQPRQRKLLLNRHIGVESGRCAEKARGAWRIAERVDWRQLENLGIGKIRIDPSGVRSFGARGPAHNIGRCPP